MSWPVSITRFNYWDHLAVNPELSHHYQLKKLFPRGVPLYVKEMFPQQGVPLGLKKMFLKGIPPHLDIPWKEECKELEEWVGKESGTRFKNSRRGKRSPKLLLDIIERDQRIFRRVNNFRLKNPEIALKGREGGISKVARKYHCSQKGVEEVYWIYTRRAYTRVGKGRYCPPIDDLKRPRSYRQARARTLKRLNAKLMTPADLTRKEWDDFYTWLATCLKNLKGLLTKP